MEDKNAIVPVTDWTKLTHSFGKGGIPIPFVKEIFLLESKVAGTGFVDDIKHKTESLKPGSVLMFQREPNNKHDKKAIKILNGKDEKIGYVPRANNEILSRLMDAGKMIYGKVKEKRVSDYDWIYIDIEIFMRDL